MKQLPVDGKGCDKAYQADCSE